MKILLAGATGYIGKRLLPALIAQGHKVVCCVRDKNRFHPDPKFRPNIEIIEVDFLDRDSLKRIPKDVDGAYYLLHSMSSSSNYEDLELRCAKNFRESVRETKIHQVIYLSGIINENSLSRHLSSRKSVELELEKGYFHLTTLRAGIIIGSGSASFEIIRDLVEKLPIMVTPKWLNTRCQPIGIRDVILFLTKSLFNEAVYDKNFDIGGPDILSYKEMLLGFAKVRGLKRVIFTVPVMTPKLSSYWLFFVTSTSYKLASALVSSMKVEVICRDNAINKILGIEPIGYEKSLKRTLYKIQGNEIPSSWKDSWSSGRMDKKVTYFLDVPEYGCFKDKRTIEVGDVSNTIDKIWQIGGTKGWYFGNWLWKLRGLLDQILGGVGLRRGRTHPEHLAPGDAVDFWRVLDANKEEGRLLLLAEMRLPGEAWLEFKIEKNSLIQTATFRPKGLSGRLYWYLVLPFHGYIFKGMIKELSKSTSTLSKSDLP
ncbi:MAG: SDR family oxidoreductase [Saprospiraceae bacterium]|nr:SDR family oxidoreductase [Saprospiraceae bacterium]